MTVRLVNAGTATLTDVVNDAKSTERVTVVSLRRP
jgi:hypothetical protein